MTLPNLLITPPWQDKTLRLKAPIFPDALQLDTLPTLLLKDGTPVAHEQIKNLLGLVLKSDFKSWVKPLTDESFLALLSAFDKVSLHNLAKALQQQLGLDWYGYAFLTPLDKEMVDNISNYLEYYGAIVQERKKLTKEVENKHSDLRFKPEQLKQKIEEVLDEKYPLPSDIDKSLLLQILVFNFNLYRSQPALFGLFFHQNTGKPIHRGVAKRYIKSLMQTTQLSEMELYEYSIPDFGFVNGQKTLEIDNVTLQFRLTHALKIQLFKDGQPIKTFPKIKKSNNAELWQKHSDELKETQKYLTKFFSQQSKDLAKQIRYQTPRKFYHFTECYLKNPILHKIAQTLIWGVFHNNHHFICAFLVSEDGSWLNSDYDDIKADILATIDNKPDDYYVAPLHPAHLNQKEHAGFSQMIMDFEIIQICPQLSLPVYRPTEEEWQAGEITRYCDIVFSIGNFNMNSHYTFEWIFKNKDIIGFKRVLPSGEYVPVYFDYVIREQYNARVKVQPIKINQDNNTYLIHKVFEICEQAVKQNW